MSRREFGKGGGAKHYGCLELVAGIEPAPSAGKAEDLPLHYIG